MTTAPADLAERTAGVPRSPATIRAERTPPHHLEAEVATLGAALLSPTALSEIVDILRPDDLYRSAHRVIYEAVLGLYAAGLAVDPITVVDRLVSTGKLDAIGGASAIHDLVAAVPTPANALHYARIVADKAQLRRLIEAGSQVVALGYQGGEDTQLTVDRAEQLVYDVAHQPARSQCTVLRGLLGEGLDRIAQRHANDSDITGLPTGFADLDRLTAGLQPQNLIVVAARPGLGKTALALSIAQHAAIRLGRPAAVFSLEMSKAELVDRILSTQARIEATKILTGRLDDADWAALSDTAGRLAEAPLFLDDTPSATLLDIRAKCRRLKQRHGLDLVVVDYLQLMQPTRRADNRNQEVADISRGLKMLAKELDLPVLALSQLSRQTEGRADKRPQLSDLRDSGAVEADSDVVAFVYRDEVYNPNSPDRGMAEIILAKHRNGPVGLVRLAFLAHLGATFASLARPPM